MTESKKSSVAAIQTAKAPKVTEATKMSKSPKKKVEAKRICRKSI